MASKQITRIVRLSRLRAAVLELGLAHDNVRNDIEFVSLTVSFENLLHQLHGEIEKLEAAIVAANRQQDYP